MIRKISAGLALAIATAALAACTGTPSGASFAPNGPAAQSHSAHVMDGGVGGGLIN